MSWSVSAVGRASSVATKIAADFAKLKCAEPEETVKNTAGAAIASALAAHPPELPVRVEACGNQYSPDEKRPDEKINSLKVSIEPIYGFIE